MKHLFLWQVKDSQDESVGDIPIAFCSFGKRDDIDRIRSISQSDLSCDRFLGDPVGRRGDKDVSSDCQLHPKIESSIPKGGGAK